ncbi:PhzF family phenazine biosynthesis protein [Terrimonas sp. NA20]|uniref:PhzF family phenazine biosynthesis protein n=1 Tax=Terrimonas ginsenosidimutans TaxID=2908004 RepID=A0ABS9KME4_9BACT|nr:PhzF family phenazine biosynthesis protein [Terrimonas ginsenosidimutans]MCG2613492.1 PhzF family phenazine biosynthesis protein [Terrimonas ginsenosidimutans]
MNIVLQVINAFSINEQGGNPAGVVFDADKLSPLQKQEIARLAGFPETAFVSRSDVADYKLDFFTPLKQIAHCGHATIATFSYLKRTGQIAGDLSTKETIDGNRRIVFKGGQAFMEQQSPAISKTPALNVILESLRISSSDLQQGLLPSIVNTGNGFLIVPVRNEAILAGVDYDREAVYRISEQYGLIGFYLYTVSNDFDATTRMFAPFYGIDEEAATGMAAGPLAAYLWEVAGVKKQDYLIEQGRFMHPASPSLIKVELSVSDSKIERLYAGGGAHLSHVVNIGLDQPRMHEL